MAAKLTTQAVRDILEACQGTEGDLKVEGIVSYFLFNREKLESHRQDVLNLLGELSDNFRKPWGESFFQACYDKHGNHWAEHPTISALFGLGMGLGVVSYVLPREMWAVFPGGMPYFTIKDCHEDHQ